MFCPSCGKEIPDESRYCLACGKSPSAIVNIPETVPSSDLACLTGRGTSFLP
jgi:NMD protein affecting ribosome stability and mRNA decay